MENMYFNAKWNLYNLESHLLIPISICSLFITDCSVLSWAQLVPSECKWSWLVLRWSSLRKLRLWVVVKAVDCDRSQGSILRVVNPARGDRVKRGVTVWSVTLAPLGLQPPAHTDGREGQCWVGVIVIVTRLRVVLFWVVLVSHIWLTGDDRQR